MYAFYCIKIFNPKEKISNLLDFDKTHIEEKII